LVFINFLNHYDNNNIFFEFIYNKYIIYNNHLKKRRKASYLKYYIILMTSRELKRLNHYPEFKTNNGIDSIINFIQNGINPANLNARQIARFNTKFGAGSGFVVNVVNGNHTLFYNPNANINLEVVRPTQRDNVIQSIYDDIQRGLGTGLGQFYHQIAMSYLNIPKTLTDDFLRKQGDYIVAKIPYKLVNKPITSKVPNERWGVDLINMNAYNIPGVNGNKQFILTVVDYFSGKVFARALNNNQNSVARPSISNAINDICVNEAHTFPHIIQADSEFSVGAFLQWCNLNNIQLIKTTSYTPVSNGKVERMNREIRKKIKAGVIRNNNSAWFHDLQDYILNINNQQSSRNGLTPNQLWTVGYNPHPANHIVAPLVQLHDNMNTQQKQSYNESFIDNRARHTVGLGRPPRVFQNGDFVRIKLLVINNRMREVRERSLGWNKVAVHYTPQIYQVVQAIHHPANFVRRDEYHLRDNNGNVLMSGIVPKSFFGNDLALVPPNSVATNINPESTGRAIQLNRL
jgi:hypothetical protein